jgi:pyruvate/2-oxoglutarate dehydrogenase complex dihydrolipoamide dehydrogenase (E3) component
VLGGSIVGYRASEVITTVALCVKAQLTVDTLAETGAVNPSVSESLQRCAERAANARMASDTAATRVP